MRDDGTSPAPLELSRARLTAEIVPVGGLSLGALHHLLRTELDLSLSHPTLRRVHAESAGNPFMAMEIGRALTRRGLTRVGSGPLPVPATVSGLVGERLSELPTSVSSALGVVAVLADAPLDRVLAGGVAGADLDAAFTAGVVELAGGRVRFSHPVLASSVLASIPPARRRELHAQAARSSVSAEERARHRALAAASPSAEIADELDSAASAAEHRGAPAAAAELLELAASLTESGSAGRSAPAAAERRADARPGGRDPGRVRAADRPGGERPARSAPRRGAGLSGVADRGRYRGVDPAA